MSAPEPIHTLDQLESAYDRLMERTRLGRKLELPRVVRICIVLRGLCSDGYVQQCITRFQLVCERLTRLNPPAEYEEDDDLMAGLRQLRIIRDQLRYLNRQPLELREPWQTQDHPHPRSTGAPGSAESS